MGPIGVKGQAQVQEHAERSQTVPPTPSNLRSCLASVDLPAVTQRGLAAVMGATMWASPFSFPDQGLEARFLSHQLSGVIMSSDITCKIEMGVCCALMHDIYKAANGRPALAAYLWLFGAIAALLSSVAFMKLRPQEYGKRRIVINSFLRIWLAVVYTQWNGWYCRQILVLPNVRSQLAFLAQRISPVLEYLILLPLGLPALGMKPRAGNPGGPVGPSGGGVSSWLQTLGFDTERGSLECSALLSLWQLWASIGGTLAILLTEWPARRWFLHRVLVEGRGGQGNEGVVDPYLVAVCKLKVGGENLVRMIVVLAMCYALLWAMLLMDGSPALPFWLTLFG